VRTVAIIVELLFKHYFRDRSAVFWGLMFPLLLMVLIGMAFGRDENLSFTVGIVDQGNGTVGQSLRHGLSDVPIFRVTDEKDEGAALEALRRGRRTLVAVLPAPGSADPVQVYFDQARVADSRTALVILERFIAEANLRLAGVAPVLHVEARPVAGVRLLRFFDFLLPGILALTVMNSGLNGASYVITEYRQRLVLKRVLATPVPPLVFLSGLVARYAATNLVQLAVIAVIAVGVFDAVIVGSLWVLAALAVFGTLVFVGMGIAVSTLSRTPESANLLGTALSFPMMFLAGTFWSRDFMPAFLQPAIAALPLTPLVDVMRGVAARGEGIAAYWPGLLYLTAWGVGASILAAWRFRWE
jgi:ABC-2 type transport system permease protein